MKDPLSSGSLDPQRSVVLAFKISQENFVKGAQRGYLRNPFMYVIVPAAVVGLLYFAYRQHSSSPGTAVGLTVFTFVGWPVYFFVLPGRTWARKATTREVRTVTFDDSGTHHQGQTYSFDRPWSRYRKAFEFDDMYVLTFRDNSATFPKSAFKSPQQEAAFRQIVGANVRSHFLTSEGRPDLR